MVIAPWNFPIAILCGMTAACLVTGNTVLLKPAEQSNACAYYFFKHLLAAGFPTEAVHFLPGLGETVGEFLVKGKNEPVTVYRVDGRTENGEEAAAD